MTPQAERKADMRNYGENVLLACGPWYVSTGWGFDPGEPLKKFGPWLLDLSCHRSALAFVVCVDREKDDVWNWWGITCCWGSGAIQLQFQIASRALTIVRDGHR